MGDKGCYNCKNGKIDLFISTDLLFCKIHLVNFTVNSYCTEYEKLGLTWIKNALGIQELEQKVEALEKANEQANQSFVSIATQLEETEGRIMRLYEIENSTTIKKDLKEIWERHINDINMHQNQLSELKNHDIFRIWNSVRSGGKTTLDALIMNAKGIRNLEEDLRELISYVVHLYSFAKDYHPYDKLEIGQLKTKLIALKLRLEGEKEVVE